VFENGEMDGGAERESGSEMETETFNAWRTETPGIAGWERSARPGDPDKYLLLSADCHANEPPDLWQLRMDPQYRDRLPRIVERPDGLAQVTEGFRAIRLREVPLDGEDRERAKAGRTPEERLRDQDRDGIDAEILFPNKGISMWATPDPVFSNAMCRCWNDWAWETFGPHNDRLAPMACVATGDLDGAVAEIRRAAKLGFRGLSFPCTPRFGPPDADRTNYNLPAFDSLWAVVEEVDLPITFPCVPGRAPGGARGHGGAIVNYAVHAMAPAMEPVVNLCASGVLERFPGLRFATIEAGIGWIPWALIAMDEAYHKHHMWVRPKLKLLPSEYFRKHGFASFQEDPAGLDLARKHDLVDNFMWANDYPHHEGTWPHSAAAIERTMQDFRDEERAKILGLNAARLFGFEIPERERRYLDA
jgi:predicted TIM-barrel fold metal-dependent hydrolase